MNTIQVNQLTQQLFEKYGSLSVPDNDDRLHISGYRATGSGPQVSLIPHENGDLFLVISLDPLSPLGQFFGRYCIPFVPSPDFHFDKTHLWIYPIADGFIRMEIRFPAKRRFADHNDQIIEMVYGVQLKASDVDYLRPIT